MACIVAVDHINDSTVLTFNILGYNIIKFKDLIIFLSRYSCAAMGCAAIYDHMENSCIESDHTH